MNNQVFNRLCLVGTDSLGNFKWKKEYGNPKFVHLLNFDAYRAALFLENNNFYYTGLVRDSALKQIGVLIKFDYTGDTLWQKIYRDSIEDVIPQGLVKSMDNGFLITGSMQNWTNNSLSTMLMKTDIHGKELWRKKIHKPVPDIASGIAIKQDSLTKKIVIVGRQYIGNSTSWSSFSHVLITDSIGNKIIQTSYNNAGAGAYYDLIQSDDGNFIACGAWTEYTMNTVDFLRHQITKFDLNGHVIWKKSFFKASEDISSFYLWKLSGGKTLIVGTYDSINVEKNKRSKRIILYTIDKDGELLTKKFVGTPFLNNIKYQGPLSISPCEDKGFLISTWYPYNQNPRPYSIIKVDSTGCDTSAQWCLSVALSVSNFNKLSGYTFEMFPNPADEVLTLKLYAPLDKLFTLQITDPGGRLVKALELSTDNETQLNTKELNPGVYFASVYYGGKAIETKKLVVVH